MNGTLTPKEREVLQLVAEGRANKQIGRALGSSEQTVKNHVVHILRKLRADNRAHAVMIGVRQEYIRGVGPEEQRERMKTEVEDILAQVEGRLRALVEV